MGLLDGLFGGFGGGGGGMSSGGIGNSESTNKNSSDDARISGGDGSTNTSSIVTGSSNTITSTDHGAVAQSLQLALSGIEGAQQLAAQAQASAGGVLTGALSQAGEQNAKFANALENIKTSDVRVLIITGLAVVAIAAVYVFRHKG